LPQFAAYLLRLHDTTEVCTTYNPRDPAGRVALDIASRRRAHPMLAFVVRKAAWEWSFAASSTTGL